jgi:uncharacterized protein YndB with AHSA1/START domain
MIDIQERVFIDQPVERVFEYVTDPGNNALWQSGILETAVTSKESLGVGSTYRCVNRFLGVRFESAGEIVEYEPNRICTYRFTSGSVSGETRFTFESQNQGTLLTTSGRLKLKHLKLAGFLVNRKARHQVRTDLQKLKTIMENGINPNIS